MSSRGASWITAAAVAALAFAVFANSLSNGLTAEDTAAIVGAAAHHPLDWRALLSTPSGSVYRPLTAWTFAVDHALHGDRPFGYHLTNVLGHAGAAALVVLLARALGLSVAGAGLVGALFAVHPVHGEAVAAAAGRSVILAAGLALLSLLCERRAAQGSRPVLLTVAAAGACALALLADEQAICLAVLLPLAALVPVESAPPAGRRRLRQALLGLAVAGVVVGYLELRRAALGHVLAPADTIAFAANPAASAPPTLRVLTALGVLARALWLLLVPLHLSADYSYAHLPVVASAAEPAAIAGLLAAATLLALAAIVRRHPAALFWYAFAVLAWGPVSNLPFPIDTIFRERLLYLPSAGFCALLAMGLLRLAHGWRRAAATAVAAVLVLGWGVRTSRRNLTWHDERSLAESMVASASDSARAHGALGTAYASVGRHDDALRELFQALAIDPKDTGALYNAGVIYQRRGEWLQALTVFRGVTNLDPTFLAAWINVAAVNNSQAMFTPALDAADHALALRADAPSAHVARGFALRGLERLDEARDAFQEALRLAPGLPDALLGLGATAIDRRDFGEAAQAFEQLVARIPSADIYRGLVYSYRMAGRGADAARVTAAAHERYPDDTFFAPEAGDRDHR